jgi:hypothetical protein
MMMMAIAFSHTHYWPLQRVVLVQTLLLPPTTTTTTATVLQQLQ